ncbi:MAG: hypothetical protein LKJ88_03355 [Bacilli bacterium]|jgi:ribose transport system permease protein|nr:hypothetical protein [Bacilli bacterium]
MENAKKETPLSFSLKGHSKSDILMKLVPFLAFIALFIAYVLMMRGAIAKRGFGDLLSTIFNQVTTVAIASIGAIFMYAMGGFDLSFGAACAMSAMCGVIVYNSTGNIFLLFIVAIAVAVLIGLINSALAGLLKLPVFIASIASTTVISALLVNLLRLQQGGRITVNSSLFADAFWYKILALGLFFLAIEFIFCFTPLGRQAKAIGTNPVNAELSGISILKTTILAYVISGIGVGLAAALWIPANRTVSTATASSLGLDVMIALVFGAMPLSGGPHSRVSSALLGAFTSVLISQIMVVLNLSYYSGLVKGIIYIFFVFIANIGTKRANLLPK